MAEEIEKSVRDALLHMQGQLEMLKHCTAFSMSMSAIHMPWSQPLLLEAIRQKTLNILPGEGKEALEAGHEHMKNRILELFDGIEKNTSKMLDEIKKKDLLETMNDMKKNPEDFLEKIRKTLSS